MTVRRTASSTHLHLAGEVDAAVVADFQAEQGMAEPVDVIDASGVTFLCVQAAELMAVWAQVSTDAGRAAVLRRPSRHVRRVLELTGLDDELRIPSPRSAPPG